MKNIDTRYKGYRFRSRTEARWAVFFDALGLDWRYELDGVRLSVPGGREIMYLPDFYITSVPSDTRYGYTTPAMYVEIKGKIPDINEELKATYLARESMTDVLLVTDVPMDPRYRKTGDILYHPHFLPSSGAPDVDRYENINLARVFGFKPNDPVWLAAFGEAMGARFEHGETPRARRIL